MITRLILLFIQIIVYSTYTVSTVNWNGNDWALNCDFPGNDFANYPTADRDCGPKCASTQGCTHYAWFRGICYLKQGSASKNDAIDVNDPSIVCGVTIKSNSGSGNGVNWNGNDWALNCDFPGNDFANYPTADRDCGPKCASTQGCTHYAWFRGICYLKQGSASKNDAIDVNDPSIVCGVTIKSNSGSGNGVNWNGNDWALNCDFPGNDFANYPTADRDCGPKCASTQGCTHYAWFRGICYLKQGSVSKNDAIYNKDPLIVCGVVPNSDSNGGPVTSRIMGVCYDAFHSKAYPLNGAALNSAALRQAIDNDFSQMSNFFKYVRTFYSSFYDIPVAPSAAKYGVKLYLGVFMTNEAWYQSQVDAAVAAVKNYPDTVLAILIGNENLRPNGPYSADDIIARIQSLRDIIKRSTNRNVPIGTVQRITEWVNPNINSETSKLANACDIIGVNIYPFFGQYDYSNPIQPLDQQWRQMISRYGLNKVRLTETGFPSAGGQSPSGVRADLQTEISYYKAVANWQQSQSQGPAFWFAFHDRRADDNSVPGEFEKHFGLFTSDSQRKANNLP